MTIQKPPRKFRKPLLFAAAAAHVLLVGIAATVAIETLVTQFGDEPYAPIYGSGYDAPQVADNTVVAGQSIISTATKCSHENAVGVTGTVTLIKLQPPPIPLPVIILSGARVADKGCVTKTYSTPIPADTQPGTYELVGAEQATDGKGRIQQIVWHTERFEVLAP